MKSHWPSRRLESPTSRLTFDQTQLKKSKLRVIGLCEGILLTKGQWRAKMYRHHVHSDTIIITLKIKYVPWTPNPLPPQLLGSTNFALIWLLRNCICVPEIATNWASVSGVADFSLIKLVTCSYYRKYSTAYMPNLEKPSINFQPLTHEAIH